MESPELGKLITGEAYRDAVHIAIAPVIASGNFKSGDHIGVRDGIAINDNHTGIVDPLLPDGVKTGQKFYIWLYPNTITSLRHNWEHPDFPKEEITQVESDEDRKESKEWLTEYAKLFDLSYSDLIEAGMTYVKHGESICLNFDTPDEAYTQKEDFWRHFEIVTGTRVKDKDVHIFHCSC